MYIKTDLTYSDTELTHLNACNADIESQWIVIKLHQTRPIIICNMYRPPSGNVTNALSTLSDAINTLTHPHEIYLIGDFNINYKDHMSDNYKKIKFFERSNTLKQIITVPTRYSTTRNSLLDIILTNSTNYAYCGNVSLDLNDHLPIYINRKKPKTNKTMVPLKVDLTEITTRVYVLKC